jgi:hypothetical protein
LRITLILNYLLLKALWSFTCSKFRKSNTPPAARIRVKYYQNGKIMLSTNVGMKAALIADVPGFLGCCKADPQQEQQDSQTRHIHLTLLLRRGGHLKR